MKFIAKGVEPRVFREWKTGSSPDWIPSFAALGGPTKAALKEALLSEQGFVCCYCERRVSASEHDERCHIEHLVPQQACPERDLDYSNLLCSCTATHSAHCGMRKDRDTIEFHPLQHDCASSVRYSSDGSVAPRPGARHAAAAKTIVTLGLNDPTLQYLRRRAVGDFLLITRALPPQQVAASAHALLATDSTGRSIPFASAVQCIFVP